MAKTLHKAAALEARLAKLAGPEWLSDEEDDDSDSLGEAEAEVSTNFDKRADIVALSETVQGQLKAGAKKKGGKVPTTLAAAPKASAVVYLGHIPHGFFEDQMKGFFGQFGTVKQLRLSRSKKTARSKGYAFIEFEDPEVAQIVAETMNGYFLERKRLVCEVIPTEKIHENMFAGADRKFVKIPWRKLEREKRSKSKTEEGAKVLLKRLSAQENKKRKQLEALGIDYDFPGYNAAIEESGITRLLEDGPQKEEKEGDRKKKTKVVEQKEEKLLLTEKEEEAKTTKKRRGVEVEKEEKEVKKAKKSGELGAGKGCKKEGKAAPSKVTKGNKKEPANKEETSKTTAATPTTTSTKDKKAKAKAPTKSEKKVESKKAGGSKAPEVSTSTSKEGDAAKPVTTGGGKAGKGKGKKGAEEGATSSKEVVTSKVKKSPGAGKGGAPKGKGAKKSGK